jgi:hypothetical protein
MLWVTCTFCELQSARRKKNTMEVGAPKVTNAPHGTIIFAKPLIQLNPNPWA